jgi:hypothetical protein
MDSLGLEGDSPAVGELSISAKCLQRYFDCFGGLSGGAESAGKPAARGAKPAQAAQLEAAAQSVEIVLGEEARLVTHVAFAGRLSGTVQLLSGETVEVIEFDMRGTSSWNTKALLETLPEGTLSNEDAVMLVGRLINRLYQEIRNDGQSPQERALNYGATAAVRLLGGFLHDPQGPFVRYAAASLKDVALDTVEVHPAPCRRVDSDPYEVEISFFDFSTITRGQTVLSLTVDVADVVPRLDSYRLFTRR